MALLPYDKIKDHFINYKGFKEELENLDAFLFELFKIPNIKDRTMTI